MQPYDHQEAIFLTEDIGDTLCTLLPILMALVDKILLTTRIEEDWFQPASLQFYLHLANAIMKKNITLMCLLSSLLNGDGRNTFFLNVLQL